MSDNDQSNNTFGASNCSVFLISHTHWDREWYLSQRQFQFLLGDTLDAVLDLLDTDAAFGCFVADGQTSLLQDYLAIRPQRRDQLDRLVLAGRLAVGPWYTMPDLWLPSGEALIRNLLRGRVDCEQLGVSPQQVGYVPDSFGHIEQMPQILNGFGIDSYFFSRGKAESLADDGPLTFRWLGPDGQSELLASRLPGGYHNAMLLPPVSQRDALLARVDQAVGECQRASGPAGLALLFNGIDHIWVQRDLPAILQTLTDARPNWTFHHGTLADYQARLREAVEGDALPVWQGCLRDPQLKGVHLHGTWSSRIDNKIENSHAGWLLEALAEPLASLGWALGHADRRPVLRLAWEQMLQNHAHDSICGCSDDRVHEDVNQRFRHAQELAEMLVADSGRTLAARMVDGPSPSVVRAVGLAGAGGGVEVMLNLLEPSDSLVLVDETGTAWPTQLLSRRVLRRQDAVMKPAANDMDSQTHTFHEHRVFAKLPDASPLEVRAFDVQTRASPAVAEPVVAQQASLSNGRLTVEAQADGTLTVTHHPTGRRYAGLLALLDDGDAGGGYMFQPVADADDPRRSADAVHAEVAVLEHGPLRGKLRITYGWPLPAGLAPNREARQRETRLCPVVLEVTLEAASERLDVNLMFDNAVQDHRVRVAVPLPFAVEAVDVERAFVVAREDLGRFEAEPGQDTHPMRHWVDAADDAGGVAFIGHGLHEYGVASNAKNATTLCVTLLRAVPYVFYCGSWQTPAAQLPGKLEYDFAMQFHTGDWQAARLPQQATQWLSPQFVETVPLTPAPPWAERPHASVALEEQVDDAWHPTPSHRSAWRSHFGERDGWRRDEPLAQPHKPLPQRLQPLIVEAGDVMLSTLKPAERDEEQGLILRVFSCSPQPQQVVLKVNLPIAGVHACDLAEQLLEAVPVKDHRLNLTLRPFEIQTIHLSCKA
ncbi:glycosyl hydrolase-related protein [Phycisphaerales bacterium AB-hyl4]|uniref:Glycosyl hydrolase-related protein n=1 Tax=Natronomicrosphaera hydrolytica TaxID=3242702 RepID=A0ABV4U5Q2_9BACT